MGDLEPTGHGPARTAYARALTALLAEAGSPTAEEVADWIRTNRRHHNKVTTVTEWIKSDPVVPRSAERFEYLVQYLHHRQRKSLPEAVLGRWKQRWNSARREALRPEQPGTDLALAILEGEPSVVDHSDPATVTGRGEDRGRGLLVVGKIPEEPEGFVNREQVKALENGLAGQRVAVVVTGMRGAGKTHIAAAYARRVLNSGRGLLGWINAESVDTLHTGLAEIARRIGVDAADGDTRASAHRLRDHLHTRDESGLLVFDNATDVEQVWPLLPTTGRTRVVITTTNRAFTRRPSAVVDVGTGYTRAESVTYLIDTTGRDDRAGATAVATELGDLPLALAAAAATIVTNPGLDYQRYLDRLHRRTLPKALRQYEGHEHPLPVHQAIMLSIDAAETPTGDQKLDDVVAWILDVFCVLAPSGVSRDLLTHPEADLDELVDDAIDRCVQYCLLSWSTDNDTVLAHRLTARVLRERAHEDGSFDRVITHALRLLQPRLFHADHAWARRTEGAHLVDQIDAISGNTPPDSVGHDQLTKILAMRRWTARQLIRAADLHRAVAFADRALSFHEHILGPDHPDTLSARQLAAYGYRVTGRVEESITRFGRNLCDRQRVLGTDHPDTLTSRYHLADAYRHIGRFDEAISLFKSTLGDRERILGNDHQETLASRHNLAFAYLGAGRLDVAIPLFEQTVADRERILGPDHPRTLAATNSLALAYRVAGRVDEAIPMHQRTLIGRARVLGADHPETLLSRHNFANAVWRAGRVDEALQLHLQTLADRERVLGNDHPDTLASRHSLAGTYLLSDRLDEAILLLERTLSDRERILGIQHPATLTSCYHLADAYRAADRLDEAIELTERTLTARRHTLGTDHPDTVATDELLMRLNLLLHNRDLAE
ncbi:FxSxx-COOH system tetratricopeptide repeat protein [Nocardia arizonensis]|uniref:FxSxx-COOH system tetratricopeptide repeat protein n=1 Tax=Nocardia arizonensis TaxID=1141647 RepID=UPI0006CF91D1|nr:FxSxx-COOH system tetratricopeptide repeat protein [Nocardia arizonensis]